MTDECTCVWSGEGADRDIVSMCEACVVLLLSDDEDETELRARLRAAEKRIAELTESLAQARKDRDREALDRQTISDAWNDMRRQRDTALVRIAHLEAVIAKVRDAATNRFHINATSWDACNDIIAILDDKEGT